MKVKIRQHYYRRIRLKLKTELGSKNWMATINTLALPAVQYSFDIINWNLTEFQRLDRKIRKLQISKNKCPKANVDRLYLPRGNGRRGMMQIELFSKTSTIAINRSLFSTEEWILWLMRKRKNSKWSHSIVKEACNFARKLIINPELD